MARWYRQVEILLDAARLARVSLTKQQLGHVDQHDRKMPHILLRLISRPSQLILSSCPSRLPHSSDGIRGVLTLASMTKEGQQQQQQRQGGTR